MSWIYFVVGTLILVPVMICLIRQFMEIVGLGLGAMGMLLLFAGNILAAALAVLLALACIWRASVTAAEGKNVF